MSTFTESEAAGRWCPFARVPATEVLRPSGMSEAIGPAINRARSKAGFPMTITACLGSRCMAWRWDERTSKADAQALGFCGLVPILPSIDG